MNQMWLSEVDIFDHKRNDYQTLFLSRHLSNIAWNINTVKPVYNDHPRDSKIVAVVYRGSLFRGHLCQYGYKNLKWDQKMVGVVDRLSLFVGGR